MDLSATVRDVNQLNFFLSDFFSFGKDLCFINLSYIFIRLQAMYIFNNSHTFSLVLFVAKFHIKLRVSVKSIKTIKKEALSVLTIILIS